MKKILILTLCFLMCFITLTPTAFAKCSHKNTKWETLQEATCTKAGKRVKLCTKCGKSLKTETIKKKNHTLKRYIKKATCLDNAVAENFFGLLKTELFYLEKFDSLDQLEKAIVEYIDYYNNRRIKLKLNGLSPVQHRIQTVGAA